MKTVVHLSDLHFGREDPRVVDALITAVWTLRPAVIAVSGDLTQRARRRQFRRAARFLEALPFAQVVVPGNHDVPLFNVFARVLNPLGGYKRHIADNLAPTFTNPPVVVVGLDTTRPSSVKGARVHARDVERICEYVQQFGPDDVRVLVAHHPFDPDSHAELEALTRCGIDVILTGHLLGCAVRALSWRIISDSNARRLDGCRARGPEDGNSAVVHFRRKRCTWRDGR